MARAARAPSSPPRKSGPGPGRVGPVCAVCARLVEAGGAGWDRHRRCMLLLTAHREGWAYALAPAPDPFEEAAAGRRGALSALEACARREVTPEQAGRILALGPKGFPAEEPTPLLGSAVLSPAARRVAWAAGYYAAWGVLAFLIAATVRACVVRVEVPPWAP